MKHTKAPWKYEKELGSTVGEWLIAADFGAALRGIAIAETRPGSGDEQANASRIVACVNACEGVSTEELNAGGFVAGLIERIEAMAESLIYYYTTVDQLKTQLESTQKLAKYHQWVSGQIEHQRDMLADELRNIRDAKF